MAATKIDGQATDSATSSGLMLACKCKWLAVRHLVKLLFTLLLLLSSRTVVD